jgi:hypothetical protein
MSEKSEFLSTKFALGALGKELVSPERSKDLFHVLQVLFSRGAVDEDIVHIHHCTASERSSRPGDPQSP